MKDYLGPFEIDWRYELKNRWYSGTSRGEQGQAELPLPPIIAVDERSIQVSIQRIRIPEAEADAYLEKTLQIVTLTAEVADLKRALWEARQKQAELKTQVIDAEARLEAVQQDTLESLSPGQLAHRILNCDMLQTAELFEVAAIELRKRASE